MRVPWKRLTWILAAAVPVAAVAGIIWVGTRDLSRFQSRMTEQVRKVTGRELAARVPLSIRLGTEPAMVAEGVTLTSASWASRPELARVRKLTLFLDPASLFLGEVKIGRVLLEGADILVEAQRRGRHQPRHAAAARRLGPASRREPLAPAAHGAGLPLDQHDRGARSVLTIAEQGRPPVVLEIPAATFKSQAANQPLQLDGKFAAPRGHAAGARRHGGHLRRLDAGTAAATSMCRAASAAARLRSRAASTPRAPTSPSPRKARTSRCSALCAPAGAGRWPLCAQRQGRHLAQQLQGRGHDAEGRFQRAHRRGAVPCRSQGHTDRRRQRRCEPSRHWRSQGRAFGRACRKPAARIAGAPGADHAVPSELARPHGHVGVGAAGRDRRPGRQQGAERLGHADLGQRPVSPSAPPPRSAAARRASTLSTMQRAASGRRR